jgi:hypothetical protein
MPFSQQTFKGILMKQFFLIISTVAFITGCSTPPQAIPKIEKFLVGNCRTLMTSTNVYDYQYTVQSPLGKGVFAIAYDGKNQVCGTATVRDGETDWGRLEVLALSRCEERKKTSSVNTPCKVFAKNFEIVWDEKRKYGLE